MSGFGPEYFAPGNSFLEFLAASPDGLARLAAAPGQSVNRAHHLAEPIAPQATTIVALTYRGGVVMAGDRRATVGQHIASHEVEKVFPADAATAIGLAGVAGLAFQLVRLYQLELEHYEKIEGSALTLQGKANRLASMLRSQMDFALRGLAVLPLLAGFDEGEGRIYSFDLAGGSYFEQGYAAVGSGAVFARSSLKKQHRATGSARVAIKTALEALNDAAEDDAATGGVNAARDIYPVVAKIDAHGYQRIDDAELAALLGVTK